MKLNEFKKDLKEAHELVCELHRLVERINKYVNVDNTRRDGFRDRITSDVLRTEKMRRHIEWLCRRHQIKL